MVIFVSVLYLLYKKETYCQYVLATLGLACSTRCFSVSALGVKQEPKKAFCFHMLLWCIPCPVKTSFQIIGVQAGGARGAAAPPNFGQLRFFGQQEKIWAKPAFKDVSCFFY